MKKLTSSTIYIYLFVFLWLKPQPLFTGERTSCPWPHIEPLRTILLTIGGHGLAAESESQKYAEKLQVITICTGI